MNRKYADAGNGQNSIEYNEGLSDGLNNYPDKPRRSFISEKHYQEYMRGYNNGCRSRIKKNDRRSR